MDVSEVKRMYAGPLAPVLTVYKEDDLSVDYEAIETNVEQQIARGMTKGNGTLLAAGAGGDFPLLSQEERKQVVKKVADVAADRATVLGCCQSPLTEESIELAQWCQDVGCYGIQLSPTWYFPPNESQVYEHFKTVAENVDISIMVYHTPWLDSHISIELFKRMWEEFPNIRAIKWTGVTARETIAGYVELADKYAIVKNGGGLLEAALLGATGFVTHLANVWPEHEVELWKTLERGDYEQATEEFVNVNYPWGQLRRWAYNEIARGESLLVKPAADMTGFIGGPSRPPFVTFNEEQRAHVRSVLEGIGAPLV